MDHAEGTTTLPTDRIGPSPSGWIVNLTFHGVGETKRVLSHAEASLWLSQKSFGAIVETIGDRKEFRLTFDDANESDVTIALPALLRQGVHATFFLPASQLGLRGFLTAMDVRTLVDAGMTVGSHGMQHRSWRGLPADQLNVELAEARHRLEDVAGVPISQAACPFGSYDRRVLKQLKALGFERVFTSDGGRSRADHWLQPRNSVRGTDGSDLVERLLTNPSLQERLLRSTKLTIKKWR